MKSLNHLLFKLSMPALLFLIMTAVVSAQALPNKQEVSLPAPANLKIDGNAIDWNERFQAYNNATGLFYTIANDDENLYLIVRATKPRIIQKIISVGITFTVNNTGKKNNKPKESIAITYPQLPRAYIMGILKNSGNKANNNVGVRDIRPPEELLSRTDSTILLANNIFTANSKSIKITGEYENADSLISIYNEQRIKVAAAFDNKGVYTYELAVPLKFLRLSVADGQKFSYNIKLNSQLIEKRGLGYRIVYDRTGGTTTMIDTDQDLDSTTEFWADCTLAKK